MYSHLSHGSNSSNNVRPVYRNGDPPWVLKPPANENPLIKIPHPTEMNPKAIPVSIPAPGLLASTSATADIAAAASQHFSYNYSLMNQMYPTGYKCELVNKKSSGKGAHLCKCGAAFNNSSELKSHHSQAHHKEIEATAGAATRKGCDICGAEIVNRNKKRFQNRTRCQNCIDDCLASQGMKGRYQRRPPCPQKCKNCNGSGVIFEGRDDKPFHCTLCNNTFSRYSSLWSHKRLHSGDKPFACDQCDASFAKQAYLKNHKRVHSGEKPFKCSTCGQEFSQGPHLKNHERIHTGERPYVCEICQKRFSRHSTLWNHRRIHTGEKPYRCDICGSSFSQGTHLKNHRKVHTGERPFRCDICDVGFSDRFTLKRHRNVHGGANGGGGSSSNSNQGPEESTGPSLVDLYKCEVGQVAFPGCQRPPEDEKPL
ncbi:zinc finger protein 436-like isoform X2 [Cloeon dipterum]|uniref:zinc finger protein 436-like isoform X2 n=1 Tax=Cloeon dipterum TaxID=197152 RepID=UPI0032203CF2